MNAPASTSVGINGDRVVLAFGVRFDVRYGKTDTVIRDALLESRAANGDLVFRVDPDGDGTNGGTRRVKPASIDSIVGSGVDHSLDSAPIIPDRLDGETGSAYLARLERVMGSSYVTWIGTETGQAALASVAVEERASRKAKPPTLTKAGRKKLVEAGADPEAVAAATSAEDVPGVVVVRTGKAYADRNQVWKCGSCKGRTRKPVCTGRPDGSHDPVSAPAGKRLVDRTGK